MGKICIPVVGPSFEEVADQLEVASKAGDMVEMRIDLFHSIVVAELRYFRGAYPLPMIFTMREDEPDHLSLRPDFIDLEEDLYERLAHFKLRGTETICSYHDFGETPADLDAKLEEMQKHRADTYKIATMANSTLDALRMLDFIRRHPHVRIVGLCMGRDGRLSRILGPLVGVPWTYAPISRDAATAEGQLTVGELIRTYDFNRINSETEILGVIGDPVTYSLGRHIHNAVFRAFGINAVYIPMRVTSEEIKAFIELIRTFNLRGLSVTMPLKQAVMETLDEIDDDAKEMEAVNTLEMRQGKLVGHNTDAAGALDAVEELGAVEGRLVVVLGYGGAGRAIAHEARARGAKVVVLNRTQKEGVDGDLSDLSKHAYDVVIQSTSMGMAPHENEMPIDPDHLREGTIAVEVVCKPPDTPFLKAAREKGCKLIPGFEMYIRQAVRQLKYWYGDKIEPKRAAQIIRETIRAKDLDYAESYVAGALLSASF